MAPTFRSDRVWTFGLDAKELWELVTRTDEYPTWWPWLRRFDPSGGFAEGATWQCAVVPPLPYVVRFVVHIDTMVVGESVSSHLTGDITGDATLTFTEVRSGVAARLVSRLAPTNVVLRSIGVFARPLVAWSHDWVLDQGQRKFAKYAESR